MDLAIWRFLAISVTTVSLTCFLAMLTHSHFQGADPLKLLPDLSGVGLTGRGHEDTKAREPLFSLRPCDALKMNQNHTTFADLLRKTPEPYAKALFAMAVGNKSSEWVNDTVQVFLESKYFDIRLFAWDDHDWTVYRWYSDPRVEVFNTTGMSKWQAALIHLTPDYVGRYTNLFYWDDDNKIDKSLVDHFDPDLYLRLVQYSGIDLSQPAVAKNAHLWGHRCMGVNFIKSIHRVLWVEIMAPTYSAELWKCVYEQLYWDLSSGFGLDTVVHSCVCNVWDKWEVDAFRIVHLDQKLNNKTKGDCEEEIFRYKLTKRGFNLAECFHRQSFMDTRMANRPYCISWN